MQVLTRRVNCIVTSQAKSNFLHPVLRLHRFNDGQGGRGSWINTGVVSEARLKQGLYSIIPWLADSGPLPPMSSATNTSDYIRQVADIAGVDANELMFSANKLFCPEDERARSTCFEKTALREHNMFETARVEFWTVGSHLEPLSVWLAEIVTELQPLSKKQLENVAEVVFKSHATVRARPTEHYVNLEGGPPGGYTQLIEQPVNTENGHEQSQVDGTRGHNDHHSEL